MDAKFRAALERRYDGPIPPHASAPSDYDRPWIEQLENRKRWSWQEVRRLGRLAAHAHRAFHVTHDLHHHIEWTRLRRNLDFALKSWATYRDWHRSRTGHGRQG
jgi:hypothetical protein